jgi:hypothetical protein
MDRTGAPFAELPGAGDDLGSALSGSDGRGAEQQGGSVLQLASGPILSSSRRVQPGHQQGAESVRLPSRSNDPESTGAYHATGGGTGDDDHSLVAVATVVPHTDGDAGGHAGDLGTVAPGNRVAAAAGASRNGTTPGDSGRLAYMWARLSAAGVSRAAFEITLRNWKRNNGSHLDLPFDRWTAYCTRLGMPHEDPDGVQVINYCSAIVTGDDSAQLGSPTIANVKVAIAAITVTYGIASQGQYTLSENELLQRFRKGAQQQTTHKRKAQYHWGLAQLLDHVALHMPDDAGLSEEELRLKAMVLLRVDAAARSSDLAQLFREQVQFVTDVEGREAVQVAFYRPKEWRAGQPDITEATLIRQPDARFDKLNTVCTLRRYLERSQAHVRDLVTEAAGKTPVFVSINRQTRQGQHGYVGLTADRIASVVRAYLLVVGIDTAEDGPHSIRGVSTAHEMVITRDEQGVVRRGRWRSTATFREYYDKSSKWGTPPQRLPQALLSNTSNVLRCSCALAGSHPTGTVHAESAGHSRSTEPSPPPSQSSGPRTRQASRGHTTLRDNGINTVSDSICIKKGTVFTFPRNYWLDAPDRIVTAVVTHCTQKIIYMRAYCDNSNITCPRGHAEELLHTGRASIS